MTTLTLAGIGRVDGVEVGPQANFARAHLCDGGADAIHEQSMGNP
jgi:hypothetical protein